MEEGIGQKIPPKRDWGLLRDLGIFKKVVSEGSVPDILAFSDEKNVDTIDNEDRSDDQEVEDASDDQDDGQLPEPVDSKTDGIG